MFLNQGLANRIIAEKSDIEVQAVGDNTLLRTIEVLFDEQWKELGRQYQFSPTPSISIPGFGRFIISNSPLRKYIRTSIRKLRKLRARIERLKEDPNFDPENSMTVMIERDLTQKVKVAWTQLEGIRRIWIRKNKIWEDKKNAIKADNSTNLDIEE